MEKEMENLPMAELLTIDVKQKINDYIRSKLNNYIDKIDDAVLNYFIT